MLQQCDQPGPRRLAILALRPVFAAVDQQHAVRRHPIAREREQPGLDVRRQRGRSSTAVDTLLTF